MRYKVIYIVLGCILAGVGFVVTAIAPSYSPPEEPEETAALTSDAPTSGFIGYGEDVPILSIENDGAAIEYGVPSWCEISLYAALTGENSLKDEPVMKTASTVWVRGQSSALFAKKSYGVEFFKKEGGTGKNDLEVLGMAAGHDWVLHGPYLDKSLVRNSLTYNIARQTMFWAPDTRYCEVYLNGVYQGVYLIVEAPRVTEGRIQLADRALLTGETPYLLQRNRNSTDTTALNNFANKSGKTFYPLFVRYPVDDELTARQLKWIERDVGAFERALYADYFRDEERGYKNYIDMDSFVTYLVITEFSMNKDSGFLSTYCCKDLGGRLLMGPVWDFNNGYDNYNGFPEEPGEDGDGFVIADNNWYARMIEDRAFVDAFVAKYREMRQGVLSKEYIMGYMDDAEAYLGEAIEDNFARWPQSLNWSYLGSDEDGVSRDITSYEEAQRRLRVFISERLDYLDENIELLYNSCLD